MQHPPDEFKPVKATDMFQWALWMFLIAVYSLGVFWALIVKKPGTVGTRAYWMDFGGGFLLILALSRNSWPYHPLMFQASLVLLVVMFFWHFHCTMRSKTHVHTKCVGHSRFPGRGNMPHTLELLTGLALGAAIAIGGFVPYGLFIGFSALANSTRDGLIQERDRLRSVQMADAMWEQEYMMNNFNNWKRGQRG
jgi:hypothetical protein